ncbi:MAG: magnesium transporter CorA family protein [Candidatus Moranbacteria bacterium]|nr:magnesium transporter CorA family protein [Candidatus Moranbacteria bacterium]
MISYFYKGEKQKEELMQLSSKRSGAWICVESPTQEELEYLQKEFHLEEDLLHDALDPNEVPRMENEKSGVYVFLQTPSYSKKLVTTTHPVLIILAKHGIITLSKNHMDFLDIFSQEKKRIQTSQQTRALIEFWFALNKSFTKHLVRIGKELRGLSSDVEHIRINDIAKFVEYEKTLSDFLSVLVPMRAILHRLLSEKSIRFDEKEKDLMEDLFLAMGELIETSQSSHRHVVNIREASSVIMTHTLNRSIRTLTILTIVLSIPMILGSLYGMNVNLPFDETSWIFLAIIGTSFIAMGAVFVFLLRR